MKQLMVMLVMILTFPTTTDIELDSVEPNTTIIINHVLDLQGSIIKLPIDTNILYEGGDVINGTFNCSDNTIISGELLNQTLILEGTLPRLKDTIFYFIPERWGIVQN